MKNLKIAFVHPPKVSGRYINAIKEIITTTFGTAPEKVIDTTKAVSIFAKHNGMFDNCEEALVFDMGEEDISVAKALYDGERVFVDGDEGHQPPLPIGGNDLNYLLASYVRHKIENGRTTLGAGSVEEPLLSKLYTFMRSIKSAKIALSFPVTPNSRFKDSAPVGINYDVFVQDEITRSEFKCCLGTDPSDKEMRAVIDRLGGENIAGRILKYVIDEINAPVNRGIIDPLDGKSYGAVVFCGGLSESYTLKKFLAHELGLLYPNLKIADFKAKEETDDDFDIQSHEDASYAPAIGGALAILKGEDVRMGLSYSYATWGRLSGEVLLCILADRGTPISAGSKCGDRFTVSPHTAGGVTHNYIAAPIVGEEVYSTVIARRDITIDDASIRDREYGYRNYRTARLECLKYKTESNETKWYLKIGAKDSDYRRAIEPVIQLKLVAGGANHRIMIMHGGKIVKKLYNPTNERSQPEPLPFFEGVESDERGRVKLTYEIQRSLTTGKFPSYRVEYENEWQPYRNLPTVSADQLVLVTDVESFRAVQR